MVVQGVTAKALVWKQRCDESETSRKERVLAQPLCQGTAGSVRNKALQPPDNDGSI